MTDIAHEPPGAVTTTTETDAYRRRIAKRYAAERRFKWLGIGAVATAIGFLVILLSTVIGQGLPAFTYHTATLNVDLSDVDPAAGGRANYDGLVSDALEAQFSFVEGRTERRALRSLLSTGNGFLLGNRVAAGDVVPGQAQPVDLLVDDFVDLYLKGLVAGRDRTVDAADAGGGALQLTGTTGEIAVRLPSDAFRQTVAELLEQRTDRTFGGDEINLTTGLPSVLLYADGGTIKLTGIEGVAAEGVVLVPPSDTEIEAWSIRRIDQPEANRKIDDRLIAYTDRLVAAGAIESGFNTQFFSAGASREPELAGIWGAVVGSFLTLVVTLAVSFPIGVLAAIYLEEFAPKNRLTELIEININNLAAVPSIVFGLLGLAVFLNWFDMPRSAPLVGGLVLALMTLPTIIIASRAAVRAVPPSIREAALGVGASKTQAVFHHVLPLALPGMLTGTIIGMAQALGETAPLLMIGMVAFIADIPGGFTDSATVLPVQIFMWADFPEPAFRQKTSAAIMVLLAFLVLMNALAVLLRRRFERRW